MSRYVVQAGWRDAPHLSQQDIDDMSRSISPHQLKARMDGTPTLGAGAIYPVPEEDIVVEPFQIPEWWPRLYGLDVGWNKTAAIWGALDRDTDTLYLNSEHYRGQAEAAVHAKAIRMRGEWMPGVIDSAARGRSQVDGKSLFSLYEDEGLHLHNANKAVEAGLMAVLERLSTGRLKVFSTLQHWLGEYRLYRRDEKGRVVKENDHCLHPDTQVITRQGRQRISDLVGSTGEVLTQGGRWTSYRNCRMTARNEKVVTVSFEDGSRVTCTPDHRFLTPDGWVEARDMAGLECYNAVTQSIHESQPCKSPSSPTPSKSLKGGVITCAALISRAMVSGYTARYGSARMEKWCRRVSMYTTRIMTAATTSRAISSWCQRLTTCGTTMKGMIGAFLQRQSRLPGLGMAVTPGATGIASITSEPRASSTCADPSSVSSAAPSSRLWIEASTGSAPIAARPNGGKRRGWMTRFVSALSARRSSRPTSIPASKHAAASAVVRCLGVSDAGRSDVYCLTVPETAAFAVEGGVVVHNCMDATRYLVMGLQHATTRPIERHATSARPGDLTTGY